jgi:hypothetical protein
MADVRGTLEAKSDQLNATDIMGIDLVIRIRAVQVGAGKDQPVAVYFDGDNNRPWKPSKGMRRVLAAGWGWESDNWIGKSVKLHFDASVKYAGKEVGGIRVKAMSDIDQRGIVIVEAINRQQRIPLHIAFLDTSLPPYPADKFAAALPTMTGYMQSGKMTLQQVVAKCQETGQLTQEQLAQLEAVAPVVVEAESDDNFEL